MSSRVHTRTFGSGYSRTWLRHRSAVRSNQNRAVCVSTCPLNGIAAIARSKALSRSVAMMMRRAVRQVVIVAHLAAIMVRQFRDRRVVEDAIDMAGEEFRIDHAGGSSMVAAAVRPNIGATRRSLEIFATSYGKRVSVRAGSRSPCDLATARERHEPTTDPHGDGTGRTARVRARARRRAGKKHCSGAAPRGVPGAGRGGGGRLDTRLGRIRAARLFWRSSARFSPARTPAPAITHAA